MKMRAKIKFRNSLLSRYLVIIGIALVFIPILIPVSFLASWGTNQLLHWGEFSPPHNPYNKLYGSGNNLAAAWHKEAGLLNDKTPEEIDSKLRDLKQLYPETSLFWVDAAGNTRLQLPEQDTLPEVWSLKDTITFMKARVDADPFTVVAFIGGSSTTDQGFMVLELPRKYMIKSTVNRQGDTRFYGFFLMLMLSFFLLLSYLFIRDIRKRLLRLESSTTQSNNNGLPSKTIVGRPDEIGRLEQAFNRMVDELEDSRKREIEEETLRKDLISNLSHDLRTPLTVLGSHLYSLRKEPLSEQGQQSLSLMESKMGDLDGLIDHLLSYNLLSSGRYKVTRVNQDVLRIVRSSAAAWYPLWEKNHLEADIDLPDIPLLWEIDEQGFRRVLDNLFQNLIRHASSGGYVGLATTMRRSVTALVITDHGPGLNAKSSAKGAGLGLLIVDMLLHEMGLTREIESSSSGTRIYIYPTSL
ncbi:signal transduction histidine kinase [Fontibacillus solani]|uniref:histidine kinase n=1 Tax=Fontibacillus solani TaxID=1572857 RepID=A0A7W3SPW4_9BACL|nr:HAMP domain-containing sensor histidine kinase [Fontibacillus solani]MBA9083904.1 signal transduction histidine kinase [Fontibacillus solani]